MSELSNSDVPTSDVHFATEYGQIIYDSFQKLSDKEFKYLFCREWDKTRKLILNTAKGVR